MNPTDLTEAAHEAQKRAYCPYSNYAVGVALLADGNVYYGANMENVNYSNTMHAEEVAIAQAHMAGENEYTALALVTPEDDPMPPCGSCRQTLAEYCDKDMPIYTTDGDTIIKQTLGELLPGQMSGEAVIEQSRPEANND